MRRKYLAFCSDKDGTRSEGCKRYRWSGCQQEGDINGLIVYVPRLMATAEMRFKSIKMTGVTVGCRDLPFLFEANVAVLTKSYQEGIDVLIPLRCSVTKQNGAHGTEWSCLTVQVKNRQDFPDAHMIAGDRLNIKATGAVKCNVNVPQDSSNQQCQRCRFMEKPFWACSERA